MSKRAGGRGRVPADKGHRIWWFLFGLAGLGMGVWVFRRKRKGRHSCEGCSLASVVTLGASHRARALAAYAAALACGACAGRRYARAAVRLTCPAAMNEEPDR